MVMCWVPLCRHYTERKTCRFFRFPSNPELKEQWINLIQRTTAPTKWSVICSCHFRNGDKNNLPTIIERPDERPKTQSGDVKRKFYFTTPEQRKKIVSGQTTPQKSSVVKRLAETLQSTSIREEPLATPFVEEPEEIVPPPSSGDVSEKPSTSRSAPDSRSLSRLSGASLEAEIFFLTEENRKLKEKLASVKLSFGFSHIENKDGLVLMYTGIPSTALFKVMFETMDKLELKYYAGWNVEKISKRDQLLMALMKLRLNVPHEDLGVRFGVSAGLVSNTVMTWIYALHAIFFTQLMEKIPSRDRNATCLPSAFATFTTCRIILDCTEFYSVTPKNLGKQKQTFSHYKHHNTWKVLIGVAPNGVITYVSKAYPGSLSDQKIVEHCGVLNQMTPGDLILADKGFLIKKLLPPGVNLNIPPFLTSGQFTEAQVYETQRIARARIHVERAIRRIKCFHILDKIPQYYAPHISTIVQLCAALTNFQHPLIKEVEQYYIIN